MKQEPKRLMLYFQDSKEYETVRYNAFKEHISMSKWIINRIFDKPKRKVYLDVKSKRLIIKEPSI